MGSGLHEERGSTSFGGSAATTPSAALRQASEVEENGTPVLVLCLRPAGLFWSLSKGKPFSRWARTQYSSGTFGQRVGILLPNSSLVKRLELPCRGWGPCVRAPNS